MTSELKTPLYQNYADSGAKIVEFGWMGNACSIYKYQRRT